MLGFSVLHFNMRLESGRSSERSLTHCALKRFETRVFVEVVLQSLVCDKCLMAKGASGGSKLRFHCSIYVWGWVSC